MEGYALIIEVTTRQARCYLVDTTGRISYSSERALRTFNPFPERSYIIELDPSVLWTSICESVIDCVRWVNPDRIACISTTSQRFSTVIINSNKEASVICPNVDARGVEVGDLISESLGDDAFRITGLYTSFLFTVDRVRWFREYKQELFNRIRYVTTIDGWLCHKITGSPAEEASQAAGTMLFDISKREWSEEICRIAGIQLDWLPRLVNFSEIVGYPTEDFRLITGISSRTPVVMGAGDTHCTGIGSSAQMEGQLYISMGSTAPIHLITSRPMIDDEKRIWTGCYPIDNQWVLESNAGICGIAYEWLGSSILSITQEEGIDHYAFEQLAGSAPACSRDLLAFLGPMIMNANSITRVSPSAFIFPSLLVGEKPCAADMARALFEDIAYAVRGNVEQLRKVSEILDPHFRAAGGLANSELMIQILADVLNRCILVPEEKRASAIGCSVAGISLLESRNPKSVISDLITTEKIEPSEDSSRYDLAYRRWRFIYDKLFQLM